MHINSPRPNISQMKPAKTYTDLTMMFGEDLAIIKQFLGR
jgi:hypothetical protein